MHWLNWAYWLTGMNDEGGRAYGFWSGFGADFAEFSFVVVAYSVYRRNKCQSCRRIVLKGGLGKVEGTHYETCHKHTNSDDHDTLKRQHSVLHPKMHEHLNS